MVFTARPQKKGLDYFPFDVDFFEDDKLFDIQNDYGCLGEVIYLRLLCLVYKKGYYYKFDSLDKLAAMMIKSIGNRWIGNKQTVTQVICALVEVDLFAKSLFSSNVITSESIQRRYLKACERRQSINNYEYWLLSESEVVTEFNVGNNPINVCNNGVNVYNNQVNVDRKYTKEKESKVNKRVGRKALNPPALEAVLEFFKEQNFKADGKAFFDYYSLGGWTDQNGKPVLNWKQKALSWENRERKANGGSGTEKRVKRTESTVDRNMSTAELEAMCDRLTDEEL